MKRSGFTLIEILVVLAIIMIMAAILFPVLSVGRKKANQTKCMSNLRQIGIAARMYATDHDELLPPGGYNVPTPEQPGTTPQQRVQWHDLLAANYLRNWEVLICPAASDRDYRSSYGANRHVMPWLTPGQQPCVSVDNIPYDTYTVMITEKVGRDWVAWQPSERDHPRFKEYWLPLDPRHNDQQLNILYCDGHVKPVSVGQVVEGGSILWKFRLDQQ
jgi:prepilin-type processing-associated H-X9-DG protein/prepilin-type N-terminal cleavage/methylation domain-containing protein